MADIDGDGGNRRMGVSGVEDGFGVNGCVGADLNGDRRPDLVCTGAGNAIRWYENKGVAVTRSCRIGPLLKKLFHSKRLSFTIRRSIGVRQAAGRTGFLGQAAIGRFS